MPVLPASCIISDVLAFSISELDATCTKSPVSPSFPRMSEIFPSVPTHIIQPSAHPPSKCIPPALAHLAHPRSCTPRPMPHQHQHHRSASSCLPRMHSSRAAHGSPNSRRTRALRSISLVLVSRVPGCPLSPASRSASAPPRNSLSIIYSSCPSRGARDDADAPRQPARARPVLRACASVSAPLSALTLPAFDAELLSAAPGTLSHLTLLSDSLPYAFFDDFFFAAPARGRLAHLALPHFVGVPPAVHDVPPALWCSTSSPGLVAALAPSHHLRRMTLRIASTLYNGLRTAALFGMLGCSLKELVLVLASDVDVRTCGWLLGALANTSAGLEALYSTCLSKALQMSAVQASRIAIAKCAGASYAPPVDFSAVRGLMRKKASRVSRCGHAHRWGQDCCFVWALSEESRYT